MGADLKIQYYKLSLDGKSVFNSWGMDEQLGWQRDWNITFPLQWKLDLAYSFDMPKSSVARSKVGFYI